MGNATRRERGAHPFECFLLDLADALGRYLELSAERVQRGTSAIAAQPARLDDPAAALVEAAQRLRGGQPRLHEKEVTRNPLGPLQGWGQQVAPRLLE